MYSKELLKGTLSAIILKLLAENEKMYGYQIAQKVKELSDEKILIKEGSLYPALHKLKEDGLVNIETVNIGKRIRKYYFLTSEDLIDHLCCVIEDYTDQGKSFQRTSHTS